MKRRHVGVSLAILVILICASGDLAYSQATKNIHQAAVDGVVDQVKALLEKGANVNEKEPRMGYTPLHGAARNGRKEVVELLLEKGADINAVEGSGKTALCLAVEFKQKEIVELLLAKGADINVTSGRGENALSIAKRRGFTDIVELLVAKGATDPAPQDRMGDMYYEGGEVSRPGPAGPNRMMQPAAQAAPELPPDLLTDPNAILARLKTFNGLELMVADLAKKSATETRYWGQSRYDNRTSLARAVQTQVEDELAEVRKVAVEEKAEKTTKAIDDLVKAKQERYKVVSKELLQQRREVSTGGASSRTGTRGSVRGSSRSSRTGRYSPELQGSAGGRPGYDDGAAYGTGPGEMGRPGRPARPEDQVDRETEEEVRLWADATLDNKPDLAKSLHPKILSEFAVIRAIAVEEEAKKTTAAIDGILLARQVRFDVYVKMADALKQAATAGQDPRLAGRGADQAGRTRGRTTRGATDTTRAGGRTRRR